VRGRETGGPALDAPPRPILPLLPGTPQRASHDDTRYGTTNRYPALEVAGGRVISS
jgi:hypothetical protein